MRRCFWIPVLVLSIAAPNLHAEVTLDAVVLPMPARKAPGSPWQYEAKPVSISATVSELPERTLGAALDLESDQRGFFTELPEYCFLFAWHSIWEAFLPGVVPSEAEFQKLQAAIASKTKSKRLFFDLDWSIEPKSPEGREALRQARASGSAWGHTFLQWDSFPEDERGFRSSLRAQLEGTYRQRTRRRALEELLSQQQPYCIQTAMTPGPAEIRWEHRSTPKDFQRQQTRIEMTLVSSPTEKIERLIEGSARLQSEATARLGSTIPKLTRGELRRLRAEVMAEIRNLDPHLSWREASLRWPVRQDSMARDLGGLTKEQQEFALRASLGGVLLPMIVEHTAAGQSELWIVANEQREEVDTLSAEDPEASSIIKNRIQTRGYLTCVKRWFKSFRETRMAISGGVGPSEAKWDEAAEKFISRGLEEAK